MAMLGNDPKIAVLRFPLRNQPLLIHSCPEPKALQLLQHLRKEGIEMPKTSKNRYQVCFPAIDSIWHRTVQVARRAIILVLFGLWSIQSFAQTPEGAAPVNLSSSQAEEIRELREAVRSLQAEVA